MGIVTLRTGSGLSQPEGVAVEVLETTNNLLLAFDVAPLEITGLGDELSFPSHLTRYVRFRVLQKAYAANTDGKIPSLSIFWRERYRLGIQAIKKHMARRRSDRDYRLAIKGIPAMRGKRHPRLPDSYPAVNP